MKTQELLSYLYQDNERHLKTIKEGTDKDNENRLRQTVSDRVSLMIQISNQEFSLKM
jgi:hypothetical protein